MADAQTAIACSGTFSEFTRSLEQLKGHCWRCGKELPPRRRHWCSDECGQWWWRNHDWNGARDAALKRDNYYCQKCGVDGYPITERVVWSAIPKRQFRTICGRTMFPVKLEVNHIVPRDGLGYGQGCHHHQEGLETLCQNCHLVVTARQRKLRLAQHKIRRKQ